MVVLYGRGPAHYVDIKGSKGAPRREEMLTPQVKNTMMHLNGQNLRLAAKNGRNSKTPGLHLSATHGKEAAGRLTASTPAQEGTAQLDSLLLQSPGRDSEREVENLPLRRHLKLAPLELPEDVREAQRQKMAVAVNEPCPRKVKACVRQKPVCLSALPQPVRTQQQQQQRPPKAQPMRPSPIQQTGHRHLEEVVCRGTPAPMLSKPAPPSPSPVVKAQATCGRETACQDPSALQQETGRRRLRLRRAQRLDEDQSKSNASTGGLSADEDKLAQGLQGKGQRAERAERALREASRMLEKASKRNLQQHPGDMEVSGRAIGRIAVDNLQDAVH